MAAAYFLYAFLAFFFLSLAIDFVLDGLNKNMVLRNPRLPAFFTGKITPETYDKSVAYTLARLAYGRWSTLFSAALTLGLLFSGVLPWLDGLLARHLPGP